MPRDIPAPLLAHMKSKYRTLCWCWAIKPRFGDWEGYTSLDRDLVLPSYIAAPANTPAMTYLSAGGVSVGLLPVRLNIGEDAVDVTVLRFDRAQLLNGYYRDAEFEAFRVNYGDVSQGRDVVVSGKFGKAIVGQLSASIELVTWAALSEQSPSRTVTALCDVGVYPNEKFGCGRCRNVILNDGPDRNAWTALATVVSATSRHELRVSWSGPSRAGTALPAEFKNRLSEGDVEFYATPQGGDNRGVDRSIKSFSLPNATSANLVLHEELPFVPAVGNALYLVAGCRKTRSDCDFFQNLNNFQGFCYLPLKSGVLNRKDASDTSNLPPVTEVTT